MSIPGALALIVALCLGYGVAVMRHECDRWSWQVPWLVAENRRAFRHIRQLEAALGMPLVPEPEDTQPEQGMWAAVGAYVRDSVRGAWGWLREWRARVPEEPAVEPAVAQPAPRGPHPTPQPRPEPLRVPQPEGPPTEPAAKVQLEAAFPDWQAEWAAERDAILAEARAEWDRIAEVREDA